jgi:hypothetical protein
MTPRIAVATMTIVTPPVDKRCFDTSSAVVADARIRTPDVAAAAAPSRATSRRLRSVVALRSVPAPERRAGPAAGATTAPSTAAGIAGAPSEPTRRATRKLRSATRPVFAGDSRSVDTRPPAPALAERGAYGADATPPAAPPAGALACAGSGTAGVVTARRGGAGTPEAVAGSAARAEGAAAVSAGCGAAELAPGAPDVTAAGAGGDAAAPPTAGATSIAGSGAGTVGVEASGAGRNASGST